MDLNSVGGVLLGQQRVAGPLWYMTWTWPAGKRLVEVLADLEPRVLASGHGRPFRVGTAAALHALAQGEVAAGHGGWFGSSVTSPHLRRRGPCIAKSQQFRPERPLARLPSRSNLKLRVRFG